MELRSDEGAIVVRQEQGFMAIGIIDSGNEEVDILLQRGAEMLMKWMDDAEANAYHPDLFEYEPIGEC